MHETTIVLQLIASVEEELSRRGIEGRVLSLNLLIGRLSCAHPESIRGAFELIATGTRLEGARLDIREVAPAARCRACGWSAPVEDYFAPCVQCGGSDLLLEGGQDLLLESIEIEEEE